MKIFKYLKDAWEILEGLDKTWIILKIYLEQSSRLLSRYLGYLARSCTIFTGKSQIIQDPVLESVKILADFFWNDPLGLQKDVA